MFNFFKSDKDKKLETINKIKKQILLWHHACMLVIDKGSLKKPRPQIGAILFFLGSIDCLCQTYKINDYKVFTELGIELLEIMGFKKLIIMPISMNFYTRRPDNEFALQANAEGGKKITEFIFRKNTIAPLAFGALVREWAEKPNLYPEDLPLFSSFAWNRDQYKKELGIDIPDSDDDEDDYAFDDYNFKIKSNGWEKITVNGQTYLENPEKDIWEILDGECAGEQLFTWDAAMRETKKAGKQMPTDEEFTELLRVKEYIPNLVFPGVRFANGLFDGHGTVWLWSSTVSFWGDTDAWVWEHNSDSDYSTDSQILHEFNKMCGFSVRCLKGRLTF